MIDSKRVIVDEMNGEKDITHGSQEGLYSNL